MVVVVGLPYVEYWQNLIDLNDTFLDEVRQVQDACNYSSYLDTYFKVRTHVLIPLSCIDG